MFNKRSSEIELLDDLSLSSEELRVTLAEMDFLNELFGSKSTLLGRLNQLRKKHAAYFSTHTIVIGDLGCGSGDLLRAIDKWAKLHQVDVELIGIDANPAIIRYAHDKSKAYSNIKYKTIDITSPDFSHYQFDIISMNNICHHFSDVALIQLFKQLKNQARLALIVNDLQRHWISYFAIKCISTLLYFSKLAKNDEPLSVLRAFRKKELISLLDQAGIYSYQLRWAWAFRWSIIIGCRYENKN